MLPPMLLQQFGALTVGLNSDRKDRENKPNSLNVLVTGCKTNIMSDAMKDGININPSSKSHIVLTLTGKSL